MDKLYLNPFHNESILEPKKETLNYILSFSSAYVPLPTRSGKYFDGCLN